MSSGETIETELDLKPFLKGGSRSPAFGCSSCLRMSRSRLHVLLRNYAKSRVAVTTWIQVTEMGLQGFTDGHSLLARATELTSGDPIAECEERISHYTRMCTPRDRRSEGYAQLRSNGLLFPTPHSERPTLFVNQSGQDASLYCLLISTSFSMPDAKRTPLASLFRPISVSTGRRSAGQGLGAPSGVFAGAGDVILGRRSGLSDIHVCDLRCP